MDQPYTIPIVLQDLPPAEALHQVFDSLKNLDLTISDIFTKISNRIKTDRETVSKIVQRVESAQVKVKQISENQSRATTIYSAAKYPAPTVLSNFRRVAPPDPELEADKAVALPRTEYTLTKKQALAHPHSVDTSHLFSLLTKNRATKSDTDNPMEETSKEGLGRLPAYFPSISSILLFNSDENPYKDYVSINNLEGVGGKDREEGGEGLAQAPNSLINGAYLPVFGSLGYEYKPDLGEVPMINLPMNLPLGKLANISFGTDSSENKHSIAPSVAALPSLPTFKALPAPSAKKTQPPTATSFSSSAPPSAPPSALASGPPSAPPSAPSMDGIPAPPPMAVVVGLPPSVSVIPTAPDMDAPDAPPMDDDPPPHIDAPSSDATPASPKASGGGGGGGSGDSHGDLMAAIRNRPNKLRKVAETVVEEKRAAAKPKEEPMDMMAALKARLALRHKAISGKHTIEKKEDAPSSAIPKLGSMGDDGTPAPAKTTMSDVVLGAIVKNYQDKQKEEDNDGWGEEE